jgi:hypothetical protein
VFHPEITISFAALQILRLYSPGSPLLPNLVSLNWMGDEKSLPFISSFISPSLTTITIFTRGDASPMLPPILNKLSKLSLDNHLWRISIIGWDPMQNSSIEEASSRLLLQCNHHLRKFTVNSPISASALKHTIQLPSLEEFYLGIDSFELPDPCALRIVTAALCNVEAAMCQF